MFPLTRFCFCCDLRRGCIVYSWLQLMLIIVILTKLSWFQNLVSNFIAMHHSGIMYFSLQVSFMIALQTIKGLSCVALIWGIVKNNHMFYQPWLFINGLENAIYMLITVITFIIGCAVDYNFFYFLPVFVILSAFGWYIWACIFVVYRRDMKPNIIAFDANYDNFNMNNINLTV